MEENVPTPPSAPPVHEVGRREGREVEIKLECPPDLRSSLFNLELLAAASVRPRGQRLVATYYDTPDDSLARAGISVRLRKSGARRALTVKWSLGGVDAFSRGEVEAPFSDAEPDVSVFGPEISGRVTEAARGVKLVPRFETRVHRRTAELRLGASCVEIALDEGEIVASGNRLKISECELELKDGDPAALFALAAQLTRAGLRLNPASKSQRGSLLVRGEKPSEVRAVTPHLDGAASVEDAMGAIIQSALMQFVSNWPAFLDAELPESVHQMRVALRRLRAALAIFEKTFPGAGFRRFRDEAKEFANALGRARDQDVFIDLVSEGPRQIFAAEPSFEILLSASLAKRLDAYRRAKEIVSTPDASRFVLELQAFVTSRGWRNALGTEDLPRLGRPARALADNALERLYRRARRLGKEIMVADTDQRHDLRIVLKNLRYASEFFASLYDAGAAKKFTKAVGALQDALGAHNDSASALKLVEIDAIPSEILAVGIVKGWCAREITSPESYLHDHWLAFKKVHRFWR
jgi:inorganic triphosphatase YgiF